MVMKLLGILENKNYFLFGKLKKNKWNFSQGKESTFCLQMGSIFVNIQEIQYHLNLELFYHLDTFGLYMS